jgi:hypothetical protein
MGAETLRAPFMRIGVLAFALLPACSGAPSSGLFGLPPDLQSGTAQGSGTSSTQQSAATGNDSGTGVAAADASTSPDPSDDAGDAATTVLPDAGDDGDLWDAGSDAGASAAVCPLPGKAASMIDDGSWPSPNASILPQCGRSGSWRVANDGVSAQTPLEGAPFGAFLTDTPPNGVTGYVRTWGSLSGTTTGTSAQPHWGALIGFDLDALTGTPQPYDLQATGYQGFSFWMRIGATNQLSSIVFDVPTSDTVNDSDGAFHAFTFTPPGPGAWAKISVPFTGLAQPWWTPANEIVAFDPSSAISVEWNFDSITTPGLIFDVSIGDVELW